MEVESSRTWALVSATFVTGSFQIYVACEMILKARNQGYFTMQLFHKHLHDVFEGWGMMIKAKSLLKLQRQLRKTLNKRQELTST